MCHEVRSPLNVACSGLKLLNSSSSSSINTTSSSLNEYDRSIINDIESECNSAFDLLNRLLGTMIYYYYY